MFILPNAAISRCQCGLMLADHENLLVCEQSMSETSWEPKHCTISKTTNAYGRINFTKIEADFFPKVSTINHCFVFNFIREILTLGHLIIVYALISMFNQYLRFRYDTDVKLLQELITERWRLPKTYLIMVVIGGLGGFLPESDASSKPLVIRNCL